MTKTYYIIRFFININYYPCHKNIPHKLIKTNSSIILLEYKYTNTFTIIIKLQKVSHK